MDWRVGKNRVWDSGREWKKSGVEPACAGRPLHSKVDALAGPPQGKRIYFFSGLNMPAATLVTKRRGTRRSPWAPR
jgi:hypothetical protein